MSDPAVLYRWYMWPAVVTAAIEAGLAIAVLIYGPRELALLPGILAVVLAAAAFYCRAVTARFKQ